MINMEPKERIKKLFNILSKTNSYIKEIPIEEYLINIPDKPTLWYLNLFNKKFSEFFPKENLNRQLRELDFLNFTDPNREISSKLMVKTLVNNLDNFIRLLQIREEQYNELIII